MSTLSITRPGMTRVSITWSLILGFGEKRERQTYLSGRSNTRPEQRSVPAVEEKLHCPPEGHGVPHHDKKQYGGEPSQEVPYAECNASPGTTVALLLY